MTDSSGAVSRDIPQPIQRAVRQRCGFGCVVCGMPLYEYEHMLGFAEVQRHVAEEITLLCDQHHREKTNGLLPLEVVKRANENPYNFREGVSKPYDLHFAGEECEVLIGSNHFSQKYRGNTTAVVPISIDHKPLLAFILEDGHLLLNLNLFDEFNHLILRIVNNRLVYRPTTWDIQLVGRTLTIREAHRKIMLEIQFELPNRIVINRGRLLFNGVELLISTDKIVVMGVGTIQGCEGVGLLGGLLLGPHPSSFRSYLIKLPHIPRYIEDRSAFKQWLKGTPELQEGE